MKKILFTLFIFFIFLFKTNAEEIELNAKSAILIEESTGNVIYEKNADEKLSPASMTKIMSLILIMEKLESGNLNKTDDVVVSKEASGMGGSQVFINEGETYKVDELLKGVAIASANDAVVALSEKVSGTKEKFVEEMNSKAQKLNLKNTYFKNPHGIDEEGHYSTARDMSIMARELISHSDVLNYTKRYEDYFKKKDGSQIWLVNTNKLVKFYEGMDGLKTGYTQNAGYCLTATAKRNNLRLISVVMGEESIENRTEDTLKLMNYGFNTIKKDVLIDKNKKIDTITFDYADKKSIDVYIKNSIIKVNNINSDKIKYKYDLKYDKLKLPIKKGSKVGTIIVKTNDNKIYKEDLIIKENISKKSFVKIYKNILNIISNGI